MSSSFVDFHFFLALKSQIFNFIVLVSKSKLRGTNQWILLTLHNFFICMRRATIDDAVSRVFTLLISFCFSEKNWGEKINGSSSCLCCHWRVLTIKIILICIMDMAHSHELRFSWCFFYIFYDICCGHVWTTILFGVLFSLRRGICI